jgi:hypothetical protein
MSEETSMPAATPAATETTPAAEPAAHHEMPADHSPAETPEQNYEQHFAEEHERSPDLGEIFDEARPKKLSGAQRAKLRQQYLEGELSARDQRIAELERHIGERDEGERLSQVERQAEAQRKRDEAHLARVKEAEGSIPDWSRVMAKMRGATIHEDLLGDVLASEKSALLAYHLASNPNKLAELNRLPEAQRARELGRLEGSLKMPTGKKHTSAPPPPSALKGGAAPHRALEAVDDMEEFSARLHADMAKRSSRRPGR